MEKKWECGQCGATIPEQLRNTSRRFCSVGCRESYWNDKRRRGVSREEWRQGRYAVPARAHEMTEAEAAYVAGFFDGEGHIGIVRETRKGNSSGFRYKVAMEVANTNRAVLEKVEGLLGYNCWISNPEGNNHRYPNAKPLCRIRLSRAQIKVVLPQLMPHFVVKRRIAEVAMRFMAAMDDAPMRTSRVHDQLDALYQEARALNKRGR